MFSLPARNILFGAMAACLFTAAVVAQTPNYHQNINITAAWLASDRPSTTTTPTDGSILVSPNAAAYEIEPYFANLAATGWTADSAYYSDIQAWMNWYWKNVYWPDPNYPSPPYPQKLYGDIDDFSVTFSNGTYTEQKMTGSGHPDSTDSYAATFLTLAWAYYQTGDAAQTYINSIQEELNYVGEVIVYTKQANNLTWALPNYQIQYLMDNSEAYAGLQALANIYTALDTKYSTNEYSSQATFFQAEATEMLSGIQNYLCCTGSGNNDFYDYTTYNPANPVGPTWNVWYYDSNTGNFGAVEQLYPIANGVISPSSSQAQAIYATFNQNWATGGNTNWPTLNNSDTYPWVIVAYVAALMGDTEKVNTFINSIETNYIDNNNNFAGNANHSWSCNEAGWFMRLNAYMLSH
jgi:hypothetical protein